MASKVRSPKPPHVTQSRLATGERPPKWPESPALRRSIWSGRPEYAQALPAISVTLVIIAMSLYPLSAKAEITGEGVWVPLMGEVGRRPVLLLATGGDQRLYAAGAGRVWTSPTSAAVQTADVAEGELTGQWRERGLYAPSLSWDESEGISASGPFAPVMLSEVERQVTVVLESMLEGQGDEDWLSEDAVGTLIESFEDEALPALDSPYRINGAYPQIEGVWLTSGAGLWATTQDSVIPIPDSPAPTLSVTQVGAELWVSTLGGIFKTAHYLQDLKEMELNRSRSGVGASRDQRVTWIRVSDLSNAVIVRHQERVYALKDEQLFEVKESGELIEVISPAGIQKIALERSPIPLKTIPPATPVTAQPTPKAAPKAAPKTAPKTASKIESRVTPKAVQGRLWSLTREGLWYNDPRAPAGELAWKRCIGISRPLAVLRPTPAGVLLITPQSVTRVSSDCTRVYEHRAPISESVMLNDAVWWNGKLYVATSGGVFSWEPFLEGGHAQVALRYLKRDLALFPRFFKIYQAALLEHELDPRSGGYGARPVISALMPQLRARYVSAPSRDDQLPSFNTGSRQLTLLQPTHNFEVFLEWRISLDFLTTLIDPERTSAYAESQSQLEAISGDPLSAQELEAEAGLFEEWTEDTMTSQAQRLALTTLALERRQKHRDRRQLRTYISRLHRERIGLTYKRWLSQDSDQSLKSQERALRLKEIDALLDAATGYRLKIQRTMAPAL